MFLFKTKKIIKYISDDWNEEIHRIQLHVLEEQAKIAHELNCPVVIHLRCRQPDNVLEFNKLAINVLKKVSFLNENI